VCLQSRGSQYIALLKDNPEQITDEIISRVVEQEPTLTEDKQERRAAAIAGMRYEAQRIFDDFATTWSKKNRSINCYPESNLPDVAHAQSRV
jgi:hypothetical protein